MAERQHIELWQIAAKDLGIRVEGPISVPVGQNLFVEADVLIKDFGNINGMIIVADSRKISGIESHIIDSGYGYSVYDAPADGERYNREDFIGMLSDWGWTGSSDVLPEWCRKPS